MGFWELSGVGWGVGGVEKTDIEFRYFERMTYCGIDGGAGSIFGYSSMRVA